MIDRGNLEEAMAEARRFLDKAEKLTPVLESNYIVKEHAACLRSSMDLTRALAKMRKRNSGLT